MCYSTGASGPTALSMCSRLWLVTNCSALCACLPLSTTTPVLLARIVLYDAFYSYLSRRYWNGILGPSTFIVVLILLVILCWLDTEHMQIPVHHPQIILLLKTAMMEVPVREIILKMRKMCGTAHMPRIFWPC